MRNQPIITLRAARVNRRLTLDDVAIVTNRNKDTISKYEKNSTDIPRDLMFALLDLYKMSPDYIFFGIESDFIGMNKSEERSEV